MTHLDVLQAVEKLPSFILNEDIECYFKYANKVQNGLIVDLGTGWGKSMIALGLSNPTNRVLSCDPGSYPIYQGWAKDQVEYEYKILSLIRNYDLTETVKFICLTAEECLHDQPELLDPVIDILHIDNWVELNTIDSSAFLKKWIGKVKKGGYLLIRNYGHNSRPLYTESVDRATAGLTYIETLGLIKVFQT